MAHTTKFHGGLTYYGLPGSALAKCSCTIADTLEEYGHSVDQFSAHDSDVIALACDQYRLVLRMDDQPSDIQAGKVRAGPQRVVISLQPNFPKHCDAELSEMLMAIMLYRLVNMLGAEHIEWMTPSAKLTRKQFLGVFAKIRPMQPPQPISANERFAPIEQTAEELDQHCSAMQNISIVPTTKAVPSQRFASWAGILMRSSEFRFVTRVPPLTACAVLLQSSGVI